MYAHTHTHTHAHINILYIYIYKQIHIDAHRNTHTHTHTRVLPTLVRSGRLQPLLSNFYHHSGLFYHHSQRVKSAEMLYLVQFDSTVAKV